MIKVTHFEAENIKRIKVVKADFNENGLTIIGGNNAQGKTSVLDSIAWALGGNKKAPSNPVREGSATPPSIKVTLSNGLVVERKGKNSSLTVTDPNGAQSGQTLLNNFISELALDLPKFMNSSSKDKAKIILELAGVEEELKKLEADEKVLYDQRTILGREELRKKKHAESLEFIEGLPERPVSAKELIQEQQEILSKNGDNQRKREELKRLENIGNDLRDKLAYKKSQIEQLQKEAERLEEELNKARDGYREQKNIVENLTDSSTAMIEDKLAEIDNINANIRKNMDRELAFSEAEELAKETTELTAQIEHIREQKFQLLEKVEFPLPELTINNGELIYKGQPWDCMSGAEQLIVSCSIARSLNKECGFVLMDKLEQMDKPTLQAFGEWLEQEGLQVIGTRVSTDSECSIIIEDGLVVSTTVESPKKFQEGVF